DVGISVIVIVDESAAGAHRFRQPLFSERAIVVSEVKSGLRRDVAEMKFLLGIRGDLRGDQGKDHQAREPPHPKKIHWAKMHYSEAPLVLARAAGLCLAGRPRACPELAEGTAVPTCFLPNAGSATETCSCTVCRSLLSSG